MTGEQFEALAALLSLRPGQAKDCARLVLVDGLTQPEACERTGLSRQAAHQALKRARLGLELAKRVVSP